MKLNINIDAGAKAPEIIITTAHMTEDVNRVIDFVSRNRGAGSRKRHFC